MSKAINSYLSKRAWSREYIDDLPHPDMKVSICIPMRGEEYPINILKSLLRSDLSDTRVEVIIGINHGQDTDEVIKALNVSSSEEIGHFIENKTLRNVHVIEAFDLPSKKDGVGLARKIIMDEALRRFVKLGRLDGLIVALDADCKVDQTYISDLIGLYKHDLGQMAYSFGCEHDIEAVPENKHAIKLYEKHLHLYREGLLRAGHPHSQFTIGSAMACTAIGYAAQGGMNTRQAGEEFYFLQKFIKAGYFNYLPHIVIRPSGRYSDRVPFGTGRAMLKYKETKEVVTYNPLSYNRVGEFIQWAQRWYETESFKDIPEAGEFYEEVYLREKLRSIKKETSTREAFLKRFFQFFDAFQAMKMLHWLRDQGYQDISVIDG